MAAYPPAPASFYHHAFPPEQQFHPPPYYAPHPQPQPHYTHYVQPQPQPLSLPQPYHDQVRTLFIAGLPHDVKYREVYNLFHEFPGYQSCQLKQSGKGSLVYAFSVFADQQSALAAMHALNGMDFDPETGCILHIELAKANSRTKRSRTDDGGSSSFDKRKRGPNSNFGVSHNAGVGGTMHLPGMANSSYSDTSGLPSTQSGGIMDAPGNVQDGIPALSTAHSTASTSATGGNPPCPTLFIANLGPTCSEDELTQVLSRCAGFLKLKMQIRGGLPVAFVDFQDTACSTQALNQLQNATLYSSDRAGMRVEYAKARMGLPKRERRG
ncbi:hypothetical protein SUGI_0906000 [Cryptomeria japonica]|uniref:uncharacterized protein LOC131037958 isoform X2 n=1 Tax=Cryptomeria japonica TaxID=3369 RepID=UPI002414C126|nr:uncharacterized protein LOC131037958 isoform X2 [Cryptomeria japonica]GLJ43550.1 hypothetical protein SUGI_0906000 [Cryptomeria japonica]